MNLDMCRIAVESGSGFGCKYNSSVGGADSQGLVSGRLRRPPWATIGMLTVHLDRACMEMV